MNRITKFLLISGLSGWSAAVAADNFGQSPPMLADGIRLSTKVVEVVYAMPEQITKLIFPKPVDEVSVNSMMVNITRNPVTADTKEFYLLLSPRVSHGDIDMHVVMDGQTYTFRILIGSTMVNYRKTYTLQGGPSGKSLPRVPPLAPTEVNTVNLIKMLSQYLHDPNYAEVVGKDLGNSPQGTTYLWGGAEVSLLDAWHYYKQDVIILRIEVHNPTSEAKYLSASQIEPFIANTKLDPLLTQQGTKVLLPGQTDVKYLFLQGYSVDIDGAHFELRLPATGKQLKTQ
jgi:hypothetical protein